MTITVLDMETTFTRTSKGDKDITPFCKTNEIVCIGYKIVGEPTQLHYSDEKEYTNVIQEVLDNTDILVAHNIKFDLQWLLCCGFRFDGRLHDTMVYEYLKHQGLTIPLNLSACCERYGIDVKLDKVKEYWDKGYNTNEIPRDILTEYCVNDVEITEQLFLAQLNEMECDEKTIH